MSTPTLLGIPPEVRSIIYRHVYGSQVLIDVVAERNPTFKVNYSRALLLTCKHVSHEAIEVVRAALVLRIQGLSAGWLKTGAPLALRQHMPWIGEVRLVDFENYSRDSDLDSDFDALPSLKIFDVRTHMIKLPNGKLLKFPALNTAEDAQAFFGGSEEANLKVKAKENYLRQNKSVSDAFNAPERKYKLLHSFFVFDDGIRVKGVQKRCLHLRYDMDTMNTSMRVFIDEKAGTVKVWQDDSISTYAYPSAGERDRDENVLKSEPWKRG